MFYSTLLCLQQCFSGAIPVIGVFLNHVWPVLIYDINCTGSEQTLKDCPHNGITDHSCHPREAASLICQSELHITTDHYETSTITL